MKSTHFESWIGLSRKAHDLLDRQDSKMLRMNSQAAHNEKLEYDNASSLNKIQEYCFNILVEFAMLLFKLKILDE